MTKIPYAMAIGNWLPYSETFIYDQVKHAKKYEPYVLARGLNPARENFPYDHVTSLGPVARMLYYAALPCGKFVNVIKESGSRFVHAHFGTNGALVSATAKKAAANKANGSKASSPTLEKIFRDRTLEILELYGYDEKFKKKFKKK